MSKTPKIPYAEAATIARTIHEALGPYCEKFIFAGSLRRRCREVGDIEAVVIPKTIPVPDGLFATRMARSEDFRLSVFSLGDVLGDVVDGRHVKVAVGGKFDENKELASGFKLDLFIPQPSDFGRIVAIRTGSQAFSAKLAQRWVSLGWCGVSGLGLRRIGQCTDHGKDGKHDWRLNAGLRNIQMPPDFETELDFWNFLEWKYIEPRDRT